MKYKFIRPRPLPPTKVEVEFSANEAKIVAVLIFNFLGGVGAERAQLQLFATAVSEEQGFSLADHGTRGDPVVYSDVILRRQDRKPPCRSMSEK